MKKQNIVEFTGSGNHAQAEIEPKQPVSEELEEAIAALIYRMRELGPL